MTTRDLDLGPEVAPPVGRIHRVADPRRMAVQSAQKAPVQAGPIEWSLRIQHEPSAQGRFGGNEWHWVVYLVRGQVRLPIRKRRYRRKAVAVAFLFALSTGKRSFFLGPMDERVTPTDEDDLEGMGEFFLMWPGGREVECVLTDEALYGDHNMEDLTETVKDVFRVGAAEAIL